MKIEHTLTIRIIYQSLYLKRVYMQNAEEELNFKKKSMHDIKVVWSRKSRIYDKTVGLEI